MNGSYIDVKDKTNIDGWKLLSEEVKQYFMFNSFKTQQFLSLEIGGSEETALSSEQWS